MTIESIDDVVSKLSSARGKSAAALRKAVKTLQTECENNRTRLCCILAGYEKGMAKLMAIGRFVGYAAQFGKPRPSYWGLARTTVRAWRRHANASLVVLTDQRELVASQLGDGRGVLLQPVNVSAMVEAWGLAKQLRGSDSQWRRPGVHTTPRHRRGRA